MLPTSDLTLVSALLINKETIGKIHLIGFVLDACQSIEKESMVFVILLINTFYEENQFSDCGILDNCK